MDTIRIGRRRFCARTLISSLLTRSGGELRALARDIGATGAASRLDDAAVRRDALAFVFPPLSASSGQREAA